MANQNLYGGLKTGNVEAVGKTQVKVEARVDLKVSAKRVISTTAKCFLGEVTRVEDEVKLSGRVVTRVIFIDEHDNWNSEERVDTFTEKLILKEASNVVSLVPSAHVLETKVADGGNPSFVEAMNIVDITLLGLIQREVSFVQDVKGEIEKQIEKTTVATFSRTITHVFEVEERFDLDKNCEGILGTDITAIVREVMVAEGKVTIKGVAGLNVIAVKMSEGQMIYNSAYEFDFSKSVTVAELGMDDNVVGSVSVMNVAVKAENKTKPELVVTMELCFSGFVVSNSKMEFVRDAFSFNNELVFAEGAVQESRVLPQVNSFADVEGNLTMKDGAPFISKILAVEGTKIKTMNVVTANEKVTLEGVMMATCVFECEERQIHAHKIDVPFSTAIRVDGHESTHSVQAFVSVVSCQVKVRRGKELLVDARLGVSLSSSTHVARTVVSDITLGAEKQRDDSAILIFTISEDETIWDIAKRISYPITEILRQNPHLEDGPRAGDKIFIYRQQVVNF
ncbi:MAG: DUF3794 domain-containing protein [Firmicutes bacterium]|nr:DUF3794 domain-containing protein [Bacillota bacterium]